jgi:2-oxoglutarate ferredoxin oxidoreductase subunit alpha
LPTKTEQADLLQVMFGRNGECPMPVISASGPADCFEVAQEAWRIATRFMTPVCLMTDGYIANGSEPWRIPDVDSLPKIPIQHPTSAENGDEFMPYARDERLARPWAIPGTKGLMHRIGGLEKQDITGNVSYDPDNHQHMIDLRAKKVADVADDIPLQSVLGAETGDLLVVSWGGTYGACALNSSRSFWASAFVASASASSAAILFSRASIAWRIGLYRKRFISHTRMTKLSACAPTVNQSMSTITLPRLER